VNQFVAAERARAVAWKHATSTLPPEAKRQAPWFRDGEPCTPPLDFCLPPEHAALNLLPEVRNLALELFAELGIPWHAGTDDGPGNHLLSSQVQCVNALGQMVHDPARIARAFGGVLDIAEVEQIEPGRHLTFEYTGDSDHFGEAVDGIRTRGARCTSLDAAFLFRNSTGERELALVEWKYTESYRPRKPEPDKDAVRWQRYGVALHAPDSSVRSDLLPFEALCDEPLYQLVRQQLLAHELETERAHGADRVRVVHVLPAANEAYQHSLQPPHRELGDSVSEVWRRLLRADERFVRVDDDVFLDLGITSDEYVSRYGG
jgi:hypothetical protein